jgi:hypothetical protein
MIVLIILAFIFDAAWLVAILALILAIGVLRRRPAFDFLYNSLLRRSGWVKPEVLLDHPEPHRFAQLLATLFLAGGSLALFAGLALVGWGLAYLVAALAALNAFGGFCVGCAMYYWLGRLKAPGFSQHPPEGTFPGRKPKTDRSLNDQVVEGD